MLQIKSICAIPGITARSITTKYNRPYTDFDYNRFTSISFPILSAFEYAAGHTSFLLSSNDILFEKGKLEIKLTKLPKYSGDMTISINILDEENEILDWFLKRKASTAIVRRTSKIDYMLWKLNTNEPELVKEQLLIDLLNQVRFETSPNSRNDRINAYSLKSIDRAKDFMLCNFQKKLRITDIASSAFLSPFHFCRLFKKLTGISPYQYLITIRLEEAKNLLQQGQSVSETAFNTGFQSLDHFSHAFAKYEKIEPSKVRKR
jgi:AraC-like DNA-binding protein